MPNDLITPEQHMRMLEYGRLSEAGEQLDPYPVVKLFTPDGPATWLLTEFDPEDPDIAFGLCDLGLGFPELGCVRLSEMAAIPARSASRSSATAPSSPPSVCSPMRTKPQSTASSEPDPAAPEPISGARHGGRRDERLNARPPVLRFAAAPRSAPLLAHAPRGSAPTPEIGAGARESPMTSAHRASIYERITADIVAAIEQGDGAYRVPWHHDGSAKRRPTNAATRAPYRGVNILALWTAAEANGHDQGLWATYKQWSRAPRCPKARASPMPTPSSKRSVSPSRKAATWPITARRPTRCTFAILRR